MAQKSLKNSESYKCYIPHSNNGVDLIVYEAGYEKCDPLHFWGPHKKFGYTIHYTLSGKGRLFVGDKEYLIEKDTAFFLAPDEHCYYEADEHDPWEYVWVLFGGMHAKGIINQTVFAEGVRTLYYDKDRKFEKMMRGVFQEGKEHYSDIRALANMYAFLAWLMEKYKRVHVENKQRISDIYWQQILNYININVAENSTVNKIAKAVGLERTYVYKLFLKNVGMPPTKYTELLKIYLACELLKRGKNTATAVAAELGFIDYGWFCKLFKRVTAATPSAYAANWRDFAAIPAFQIIQSKEKDYRAFFGEI